MNKMVSFMTVSMLAACASGPDPEVDATTGLERPSRSASLWDQHPESLFGNRRAREVGDLLTVLVSIDDQIEMRNDTTRNRLSERSVEMPAALGLPQWAEGVLAGDATLNPAVDISAEERMRGQGQYRRQDRITLRLAARIVSKLPNGDLVIDGRQAVQVGRDNRQLLVTGVVRSEDISRQNTIQHDRIANADIRYINGGPLSATGRRGWGNGLLDVVLPF